MFARIVVILALVSISAAARGQGVVRDDFEGPQTVLRAAGGDTQHTVQLHQRTGERAHSGRWCEQLRISGDGGTAVYYSYPVDPASVISEWTAGIWLRSDQPGLQIAARVVLPRSKHPDSGEPLTTLIRGTAYNNASSWERLQIGDLPRAVARQQRVLRAQFGPQVDAREAYVDLVLLNVYGGPGTTNVWIDDFEASGIVAPPALSAAAGVRRGASTINQPGPAAAQPTARVPVVKMTNRLTIGGQPFFPRIIEHRGEPLQRLKALGFNCVLVARAPPPELLAEAARSGIWLIAPPPADTQLAGPLAADGGGTISPAFDPVLAWYLGSGLSSRDLPAKRRAAESLGRADPRHRPIVCSPDSDLESYTRPPFKVLLARRDALGTSLELAKYGKWLSERTGLARAGAPLWATIPTQPSPELIEQMRLVAGAPVPRPVWQEAQLRALVRIALASRARGLLFTSHTRLDAPDAATQIRALTLQLVNLELDLIERWPAAGNFSLAADSSDRRTSGGVMETDRSRLLLPVFAPPGGQFVTGTQAAAKVSFKVAGVPAEDNAHELSPTRWRPLSADRVTGGKRVVLDDFSRDSLVVFTHDPHVMGNLKSRIRSNGRRAAQTARDLAAARLAAHDAIAGRLATVGRALPAAQSARARAARDLSQCDATLGTDFAKAYELARHALEVIRQMERFYWEEATAAPKRPLADPLTASFATLPAHYRFRQQITLAPRSDNRLREGNCENLDAMLRAGWKHYSMPQEAIKATVELTPRAARDSAAGLLISAAPATADRKPAVVESPPVWVTTAGVPVEAGDLVQIQAWLRIDSPIAASVDGLVILDSLSGEPLATRLSATQGWEQITLYRAAPRRGPLTVTFALAGLGEVAVDDVTIQIVRRAPARGAQAQR